MMPQTTHIKNRTPACDASIRARLYNALDDLERLLQAAPSANHDWALDSLMHVRHELTLVFKKLSALELHTAAPEPKRFIN
ncbi:MAG: hypothetical protein MI923_12885 [Phycisphaerales bacterium]|nr:hypothetical protein [Phycisphaerales bacterium]